MLTPGWSRTQRSANWAIVAPGGDERREPAHGPRPVAKSTPAKVSPDVERLAVAVVGAVVVGRTWCRSSYLPDSSPLASGTRAMMPTPAAAAAGSTSSSGFSRNMFRMICTRRDAAVARSLSAPRRTSRRSRRRRRSRRSSTSVSSASKTASSLIHRRRRAVQLHEVERVDAEVLARAVGPGAEVGRACSSRAAGRRAGPSSSRRRDAHPAELREDAPDEPLAAAVAVDVRGVDEGHARRRARSRAPRARRPRTRRPSRLRAARPRGRRMTLSGRAVRSSAAPLLQRSRSGDTGLQRAYVVLTRRP